MKLRTLQLKAFGRFTERMLEFDPGEANLLVVYGQNEAGKSTTLRAIRDLLFGIPERTGDGYLHGNSRLRLGGCLENRSGDSLPFVRRKGRIATLRDAQDREPLDDGVLEPFLGSVKPDVFQTLFGIDHERLRKGGEELLQEDGEIGKLLFSAAGMVALQQRVRELEARIEDLFLPNARKPQINTGIALLRTVRDELKRVQLTEPAWKQHGKNFRSAEKRLEEVNAQLQQQRGEQQRLTRIQQALESVSAWKEIQRNLNSLATAPLLPDDFGERREAATTALEASLPQQENARKRLQLIEEELTQVQLPESLLSGRVRIRNLQESLGSHKKAQDDRKSLVGQRQEIGRRIERLLQELERPGDLAAIEQLRLPVVERTRIQELANEHGGVLADYEGARRAVSDLQDKLVSCRQRLTELGPVPETRELRQRLRRLHAEGALESAHRKVVAALAVLESQLGVLLAQLPGWTGSLEACERLPVPGEESVQRFTRDFDEQHRQLAMTGGKLRDLDSDERNLTQKLSDMIAAGSIPSDEELRVARERRDRGWELVLATWEQREEDLAATVAWLAETGLGSDLQAAYRHCVSLADELADRLRREADRVAEKQQWDEQHRSLLKRRQEVEQEDSTSRKRLAEFESDWRSLWELVGVAPLPPEEMLGWLKKHRTIVDRAADLREQQLAASNLAQQIEAARKELVPHMVSLEGGTVSTESSLRELLERAELACETSEGRRAELEQARSRIQELEADLSRAKSAEQQAAQVVSDWTSAWRAALAPLRLDPDTTSGQATQVLTQLTHLLELHDQSEGFRTRIEGIDADASAFQTSVETLVAEVAPDLGGRSSVEAAGELAQRLESAVRAETRHQTLVSDRQTTRQTLADAETAVREARLKLQRLCEEASCESVEQLRTAEQKSAARRSLEGQREGLSKQLRQLAGGRLIDEFLAEVDELNVDELSSQISSFRPLIESLEAEQTTLIGQVKEYQLKRDQMSGGDEAAQLAERCKQIEADLEEQVRELVVLQVTRSVLDRGIEQYRKKHQGPILNRASIVFSQMTCGSFAELRADQDEQGKPVLVGLRSADQTIVQISEMSDGTRDQLYLALRIASVENWNQQHEPLPFILDDVLINFDDDRATAALQVLADLSVTTQVIYFTHHLHLLDLAGKAIKPSRWHRHTLDSVSRTP